MRQWLARLFGNLPQLTDMQQSRLQAWREIPPVPLAVSTNEMRCVVVDVESSGLDLMRDHLISIGAIAVVNGKVALGDSFYIVLKQPSVSHKENILLHGIGGTAQIDGVPAVDALLSFLEYLGKDPLVAFHVVFDQTMIRKAISQYLGFSFKHSWLDMAYIMPALNPYLADRLLTLDDWNSHFDIHNHARHNALADAIVTAQLFQIALALANKKPISDFSDLMDLEKSQRWLNSQSSYKVH
jgi:DNA polymerase-3 subunit epsilon